MESKKTINVTNKSTGQVVYTTSFGRRTFYPQQTRRNIPIEELIELASLPGGAELLEGYLFIAEPEIVQEVLDKNVEPEYWLTEAEIPNWMNTCSLEEFKDALDFAPEGTKDLIKQYAVSVPLNDYGKRQAIKEQMNFDVSMAIEALKPDKEEEELKQVKPTARRTEAAANPQRRAKIIVPDKK